MGLISTQCFNTLTC